MAIESPSLLYDLLKKKVDLLPKPLTNEKINLLAHTFRVPAKEMKDVIRKELKV